MQTITMYHRTFPVTGAPVALSLRPHATHQRHTYVVGNKVYKAVFREFSVLVPDDAKVDPEKNLLAWGVKGKKVLSTAVEILGFAESGVSGFRTEVVQRPRLKVSHGVRARRVMMKEKTAARK